MKRSLFISILTLCFFVISCSEKKQEEEIADEFIDIAAYANDHKWYYFTSDGFELTKLPQKSGISSLKPWTETLRISDANSSASSKGFMVVNRLGILYFDGKGEPMLIQDRDLFSNTTAGNLVFSDGTAYFSLSRNAFFNKDAGKSADTENRPHLIRISDDSKALYPAVTYGDLKLGNGEEITDNIFDGANWIASIKKQINDKTEFRYVQWKPSVNLNTLSPVTKQGKVQLSSSSESTFRNVNSQENFSAAPERLKTLLKAIPSDFDFSIKVKDAGGFSPRNYDHASTTATTSASAILSDRWICAVFADGTTYFSGALNNRAIINGGKTIALRLPKLPKNYIYGDFCISDGFLAVAWEESDFYKTGRSGFLIVDLANIFYNELPSLFK